MRVPWFVGGLFALSVASAHAAIEPQPGVADPHIQTVEYDSSQVVVLRVAPNYALTLEFSPDEQIQNVAVGDSAAWQVTANKSANRLFIKPVQGAVDTDMTVVTDTRLYAFELRSLPSAEPTMAYVVRFLYPAAPQAPSPLPEGAASVLYKFGGARELRPSAMSDDGRSTSITWPEKALIPVVTIVGPDGRETLANGVMRDGRYVIDGTGSRFIFRAGGKTAFAERQFRKNRRR